MLVLDSQTSLVAEERKTVTELRKAPIQYCCLKRMHNNELQYTYIYKISIFFIRICLFDLFSVFFTKINCKKIKSCLKNREKTVSWGGRKNL